MMVHKKGTLTNLELALMNAVALATLVTAMNYPAWGESLMAGNKYWISTPLFKRVGGYDKFTTYHYRLLNKLTNEGYLDARWDTTRMKSFALTAKAWQWLGLQFPSVPKSLTMEMFQDAK